jgi:hypothetical protein
MISHRAAAQVTTPNTSTPPSPQGQKPLLPKSVAKHVRAIMLGKASACFAEFAQIAGNAMQAGVLGCGTHLLVCVVGQVVNGHKLQTRLHLARVYLVSCKRREKEGVG